MNRLPPDLKKGFLTRFLAVEKKLKFPLQTIHYQLIGKRLNQLLTKLKKRLFSCRFPEGKRQVLNNPSTTL
jgi:hypothetical protein